MAELHNPLIPKNRRRLILFSLLLLLLAGAGGAVFLLPGGPVDFASRQAMELLDGKDPAAFAAASRTERDLWMRIVLKRAATGKEGRAEAIDALAKHEPAFRDFLLEMLRRGSEADQAMVREALSIRQKSPGAAPLETAYLTTIGETIAFPPPGGLPKADQLVLWFRDMMPSVAKTPEASGVLLDAVVMLLRGETFWAHADDAAYHPILSLDDRPGVAVRLKEKLDDSRYDRLQRIGVARLGIGVLKDIGSHDRFREGCISLWEKPDATVPDLILNQAKRFCFREIFALYPPETAHAFASWLFVDKKENPEEIRDELTVSPLEITRIPPLVARLRTAWLKDLKSPDKTRVRLALAGLARTGPSPEAFTAVLELSKDESLREDVTPAIAALGAYSADSVTFLINAARGPWPLVAIVAKSVINAGGDALSPPLEAVIPPIAKRLEEFFAQADDKIGGAELLAASTAAARLGTHAASVGPRLVAHYLAKKPGGREGDALLEAISRVPATWASLPEELRALLAARYLDVLRDAVEKKPGPAEPVCHLARFGSSYRTMDLNPLFVGKLGDITLSESLRRQLASPCAEALGETGLLTLAVSLAEKERKAAMAVNTGGLKGHEWLAAELQAMSDLVLRDDIADLLARGRWAEPALVKAGALHVTRAKGKATLHGQRFAVVYDAERIDENAVPAPLKTWAKAERKKAEKRKEKCRAIYGQRGDTYLAEVECLYLCADPSGRCAARTASVLEGKKGKPRKVDAGPLHGASGSSGFAPILVFAEPTVVTTLPATALTERKPDPSSPLQQWFADAIAKTDSKEPGAVTMRQWNNANGTPLLGGIDVTAGGASRTRVAVVHGGQVVDTGELPGGAQAVAAFDIDADGLVEVEARFPGAPVPLWLEFDGKRFGRFWFSAGGRALSSVGTKK